MFWVAAIFIGCNQTEFDPMSKEQLMGEKITSTTTIEKILDTYMTNYDPYTNTSTKSAGLFTADTIPMQPELIINGIVTSSDIDGNIYKYIVVQEEEPDGRAIKISVDASGLSSIYPLGKRVSVVLNGLVIGKYAQSPQIGVLYENLSRVKDDVSTGTKIYRIEPGRMPFPIAYKHIIGCGMPEPQDIKADTMTIKEIINAGPSVYNKLVCIKNAYFTGMGANFGQPASIPNDQKIFAPSTNVIGYPQSREIKDPTGSIFVSTSEYAKFANKPLPPSSSVGYITAIVGWYNDRDETLSSSKIYHQLTLRSLNDLGTGFEEYLTKNK